MCLCTQTCADILKTLLMYMDIMYRCMDNTCLCIQTLCTEIWSLYDDYDKVLSEFNCQF